MILSLPGGSAPTATLSPRGLSRTTVVAWILAFLPFLAVTLWHWGYGPELPNADYAQYLMHADALAQGRSYTDTGYINTPYGPSPWAYPPGLPLTLAPILAVFGRDMTIISVVMLSGAAAFILLAGLYFLRSGAARLGFGVALLLGLSPRFVHYALHPFTDLTFGALVWGMLLLADKPGVWGWKRVTMATLLAGVAILYRPHGLVLIPAFLLFGLLNARKKGLLPIVPGVILGGLLLAARLLLPVQLQRPFPPVGPMLRQLVAPSHSYHSVVFESLLYPFPGDALNAAYHLVASILMLVGLVAFARARGASFALVFAGLYLLFLMVVPLRNPRFLWPVFPLFLYGFLNGIRLCTRWLVRRRGPWIESAPLTVAALLALVTVVAHFGETRGLGFAQRPEAEDLFRRLRVESAEESLRVTFVRPRVLTWETGVQAMSPPPYPERVYGELCARGVTHVVLGDLGVAARRDRTMAEAVRSRSEAFEPIFGNSEFELLRFLRTDCPSGGVGVDAR